MSSRPSPSSTSLGNGTPFSIPCGTLITEKALESFSPGYSPDLAQKSPSNALEKAVVTWNGKLCVWKNTNTGTTLRIAVAKPPASQITALKDAAITIARPVPTYGNPPLEGYFRPGAQGQVQIFTGPYWIVAQSGDFLEPGDAQTLMLSLVATLTAL